LSKPGALTDTAGVEQQQGDVHMPRLLVILAFLGAVVPALAQAGDKDRAIEYLKLSRVDEAIAESLKTYEAQLLPNASAEDQANLRRLMEETIGWDAIKDRLADIVMNVYTPQEIDASIAFMKSPLGASATAKSGEFSRQFAGLLAANFQVAMQKLQAKAAQPRTGR
jgi:hypothetical protein